MGCSTPLAHRFATLAFTAQHTQNTAETWKQGGAAHKQEQEEQQQQQSEDDEVCAQLRKLFDMYRDLHERFNSQRRAWYNKAQRCIEEGAARKHMLDEALQDIEAYKRSAAHHGSRRK